MAVAHFAFDFRPRHQRGDRVDHQHVDSVGAHQRIDDFQRLFARVGLRHDQFVNVDAQFLGIARIERMFRVHKGRRAAILLRFGNGVQRQRGLARTFRAVNLDNPPLGQAANAKSDVEAERAGRDGFNLDLFPAAQLHRRAFAKGPVDLGKRGVQCFLSVHSPVLLGIDECEHSGHRPNPCQADCVDSLGAWR